MAPRRRGSATGPLAGRRRWHGIEASEALQKHQRELVGATLLDGSRQEIARALEIAGLIGSDPLMKTLFGFALTLRESASSALDVCASAAVAAFEKGHARPHIDRLLVVAAEVVIEARQQQLFDTRGAIGLA
jgi:hypothetical protein